MNSGVIAGLPIVAMGLTDPVGERYESVEAADRGGTFRTLVFEEDRLVGAIFAGLVDRGEVHRGFIETGLPLGATLRAAAEDGGLTYADVEMRGQKPPYANYVPA